MREWPACWWVLGALVVAGCGSGSATVAGGESGAATTPTAPMAESSVAPSPTPSAAQDGCPEQFASDAEQPWVPEAPTTETPGRLVPDADPVDALVCRYAPLAEGPSELVGERLLPGPLTAVRGDLALPERRSNAGEGCKQIAGAQVPHLVRLRYADGELWLSAVQEPNECTATGNGAFVTSTYLGDVFAAAYETGAWPAALMADPESTR